MICPYCTYKYEHWNVDLCEMEFTDELMGAFYKLPIEMVQPSDRYWQSYKRDVFGCPSCNKIFMGD